MWTNEYITLILGVSVLIHSDIKHLWLKSRGCKKNKIFNAKGEKITIFARKYSKNNFGNIDIPGNARVIYQAQWMNECKVYGPR